MEEWRVESANIHCILIACNDLGRKDQHPDTGMSRELGRRFYNASSREHLGMRERFGNSRISMSVLYGHIDSASTFDCTLKRTVKK